MGEKAALDPLSGNQVPPPLPATIRHRFVAPADGAGTAYQGAWPEVAYRNKPADRAGYEMFRRVVTHLSAIQDQNQLHAEPLVYYRTWTIPADSPEPKASKRYKKSIS